MDFIWTNNPQMLPQLVDTLAAHHPDGVAPPFRESGTAGAIAVLKQPYRGLAPLRSGHMVTAVLGDPLLQAVEGPGDGAVGRTEIIARLWADGRQADLQPYHPALLIRADLNAGTLSLVTDAYGAVAAYAAREGDAYYVASTPDLIAALIKPELDPVSAAELVSAYRISFPNTLYRGVEQLMPGSVLELPSGETQRWWTPPPADPELEESEWLKRLRAAVEDCVRRIGTQVGKNGLTTLSGGSDGRAIAAAAARALNVSAITLTSDFNVQVHTARAVARALNIDWRWIKRPRDHYKLLYLEPPLQLGTQNLWTHAHFHSRCIDPEQSAPFALGGYCGDTLLKGAGKQFGKRQRSIKNGLLQADDPAWMMDRFPSSLLPEQLAEISLRWTEADALLGMDNGHAEDLRIAYPLTRQLSSMHFQAARRNAAQYELFMTAKVLELAFLLPRARKSSDVVSRALPAHNDRLQALAVNPSDRPSLFWKVLGWIGYDPRGYRGIQGSWSPGGKPLDDPDVRKVVMERIHPALALLGLQGEVPKEASRVMACLQVSTALDLTRHQ